LGYFRDLWDNIKIDKIEEEIRRANDTLEYTKKLSLSSFDLGHFVDSWDKIKIDPEEESDMQEYLSESQIRFKLAELRNENIKVMKVKKLDYSASYGSFSEKFIIWKEYIDLQFKLTLPLENEEQIQYYETCK
jgi:hypothetical protein